MVSHFEMWRDSGRINCIAIDDERGNPTPAVLFDLPVGATDREASNLGVEMMNLCGWNIDAAAGGFDRYPAQFLALDLADDRVRLRGLDEAIDPLRTSPEWIGNARKSGGCAVAFAILPESDTTDPNTRYDQARRAGRLWGGWIDLEGISSHSADDAALDQSLPLRTGLQPADLPRAREQTATWVAKATSGTTAVTLRTDGEDTTLAAAIAPTLEGASLWWASRDMTILTATGQSTLREAALDDLVDRRGLFCFDGGLVLPVTGRVIDAISWSAGASGVAVTTWAHRRRWPEAVRTRAEINGVALPPFVPLTHGRLQGSRFAPGDLADDGEAFVTVCCAGALIEQASSIRRTIERPPKKHRAAARRDGRTLPDVAVVDVVRARRTATEPREDADAPKRTYVHQWIVDGHWRYQACGPGRATHKRIWIEPHYKGPEDAPLLVRERVNLWRR